jgi:hypothetical protein
LSYDRWQPRVASRYSISPPASRDIAPSLLGAALALTVLFASRPASAFENQWHLGAGLGVEALSDAYRAGGGLVLHGAYGLSDQYDLGLELGIFSHALEKVTASDTLSTAVGTFAYKIDVGEWVPYLGVRAGYYRFSALPPERFRRSGLVLGGVGGLHYAVTRDIGVGGELSLDALLPRGQAGAVVLFGEYRWGP